MIGSLTGSVVGLLRRNRRPNPASLDAALPRARSRALAIERKPAVPCPPSRTDSVFRYAIETGRTRLIITGAVMAFAFAVVGARVVEVSALSAPGDNRPTRTAYLGEIRMDRAPIVDRNGVLLATSLKTVSLSANPQKLLEPEIAAHRLAQALPEIDPVKLSEEFASDRRFVWVHRQLTPKQQDAVNRLGIPGLEWHEAETRVYPQGPLLSHVVGFTDIDNKGLSGIERRFDTRLKEQAEPLALSIDIRMQHVVHDELSKAVEEFNALGGTGIVTDVETGEVLAMVSLPDYDPNHPSDAPEHHRFNRATQGVYELGSTFKIFNTAMALDSGVTDLAGGYDASKPIRVARFTIRDYHAENRYLTVPEIFLHSSNIGSAKMALEVGPMAQREFMDRLGFLDPLEVELNGPGHPQFPEKWRPINTMTISYGHGLSITPLHLANGVSAMVNGGIMRRPTLIKRETPSAGERVVKPHVSDTIRRLMRLNTLDGTGGKADARGYLVGGKTGTAEKPGTHGYKRRALISSFVAAFPMHDPKYVVYIVLDEPKGTKETFGYATGGWVAAPAVGNIVDRIAPIAGIRPVLEKGLPEIQQALALELPSPEDKRQKQLASFTKAIANAGD